MVSCCCWHGGGVRPLLRMTSIFDRAEIVEKKDDNCIG